MTLRLPISFFFLMFFFRWKAETKPVQCTHGLLTIRWRQRALRNVWNRFLVGRVSSIFLHFQYKHFDFWHFLHVSVESPSWAVSNYCYSMLLFSANSPYVLTVRWHPLRLKSRSKILLHPSPWHTKVQNALIAPFLHCNEWLKIAQAAEIEAMIELLSCISISMSNVKNP